MRNLRETAHESPLQFRRSNWKARGQTIALHIFPLRQKKLPSLLDSQSTWPPTFNFASKTSTESDFIRSIRLIANGGSSSKALRKLYLSARLGRWCANFDRAGRPWPSRWCGKTSIRRSPTGSAARSGLRTLRITPPSPLPAQSAGRAGASGWRAARRPARARGR